MSKIEDGGYEIRQHNGCMVTWYEARMVNGEACAFWEYGSGPMANYHPEWPDASRLHMHTSAEEARDCARERLAMGLTMPGPPR